MEEIFNRAPIGISDKADVEALYAKVKEANVSAVKKGQMCAIVGSSGSKFEVQLCDCDDPALIRILGLAIADTAQNASGTVVYKGILEEVDTRTTNTDVNPNAETWSAGDMLFVSRTPGGLTNVRPTSGRCIKAGRTLKGSSASDTLLAIVHTNSICACAAAGEDMCSRMGDSAGVNKFCFKDYDNNVVGCIDSNGNATWEGLQAKRQVADTKTDTYNITSADFGKSLRMNSAGDKIFNLPSVGATDDGARVTIQKLGAGKVTIDAVDSDKIADSGAGATIYNDVATEIYANITLEYIHSVVTWFIVGGHGTWVTTI